MREFDSHHPLHDPIAQSVEHLAFNQSVHGSSPCGVTKKLIRLTIVCDCLDGEAVCAVVPFVGCVPLDPDEFWFEV